jgi:glycosyltransferase involved in cell wall biosynthesis
MTGRDNPVGSRRLLMTLDAVGGVWRYALDLASGLRSNRVDVVFAGLGPKPSAEQTREAEALGKLVWLDAPLDWMAEDERALRPVPDLIANLVEREGIDLVHLNLPSQAAGLAIEIPVVIVSHSCVVTWFATVRGHAVPDDWQWQFRLNRQGFDRADAVVAPSRSHAASLQQAYGPISGMQVVRNASLVEHPRGPKENFVFAAGRWWDDGKNGVVLDGAANHVDWPVVMAGANRGPNGQYLPLENVQWRGELSHDQTMALMGRAAIVASPSVYEPFGLAALEAARSRSALVLADIPTYRELWDRAALFADPHDPQAFAGAINRLSRDRRLREELAEAALSRARHYTPEAQVATVMQIYDRLLPANHHARTAAE